MTRMTWGIRHCRWAYRRYGSYRRLCRWWRALPGYDSIGAINRETAILDAIWRGEH